jgi:hypothetical protein
MKLSFQIGFGIVLGYLGVSLVIPVLVNIALWWLR